MPSPGEAVGMIDGENLNLSGKFGLSPRKRIKTGAYDDILPYSSRHRLGQTIFKSTETARSRQPKGRQNISRVPCVSIVAFRRVIPPVLAERS